MYRFDAEGRPAPFAALGTNAIDGREANGKPCSTEPASCDQTPEDEIDFSSAQIAIDESSGPTGGDIYVSQSYIASEPFRRVRVIDIFAEDGRYLGQLTAAKSDLFSSLNGVAVGPTERPDRRYLLLVEWSVVRSVVRKCGPLTP